LTGPAAALVRVERSRQAVSSVKNNGPHLIDPLPPDGVDPLDKPAAPEETTLF